MFKPELVVTPLDVTHAQELLTIGADAVVVGEERFGLRLAGNFALDAIATVCEFAHAQNKKVYVSMTGIFHNDELPGVAKYLQKLTEIQPDGIVFGDPSVLMLAKEQGMTIPLQWSTETLATNWYSVNYWGRKGSKRAVLAKEITLDSVVEMQEKTEVELEVQVHGTLCMFQSRRTLLENYFLYLSRKDAKALKQQQGLLLVDDERESKYPIFEDYHGTHILSAGDVCMIDELPAFIDARVAALKIEGLGKSREYISTITQLYVQGITLYQTTPELYVQQKREFMQQIESLQPHYRPLNKGFFFKPTVY
ncbi:MAG: peptidase U32 family protein [Culicoidibacterales bacterium]